MAVGTGELDDGEVVTGAGVLRLAGGDHVAVPVHHDGAGGILAAAGRAVERVALRPQLGSGERGELDDDEVVAAPGIGRGLGGTRDDQVGAGVHRHGDRVVLRLDRVVRGERRVRQRLLPGPCVGGEQRQARPDADQSSPVTHAVDSSAGVSNRGFAVVQPIPIHVSSSGTRFVRDRAG